MKTTDLAITVLEKNIHINMCDTGRGISVTISGGDSGHIGAVSIKTPETDVITEVFPGHKEALISEMWANRLCDAYKVPVVVSCGIHYDQITPEQIQEVCLAMEETLEKVLSEI